MGSRKDHEPNTVVLGRGYLDDDLTIHNPGKPGTGSLSTSVRDFIAAYDAAIEAAEERGKRMFVVEQESRRIADVLAVNWDLIPEGKKKLISDSIAKMWEWKISDGD